MARTGTIHDTNFSRFKDLIDVCVSIGVAYNPSDPQIRIPALNTLKTNVGTAIDNEKNSATSNDTFENDREVTFQPLKKLATRSYLFLDHVRYLSHIGCCEGSFLAMQHACQIVSLLVLIL